MGLSVPRNAIAEEGRGVGGARRLIVMFLPGHVLELGKKPDAIEQLPQDMEVEMQMQMQMETNRPPRSKQTSNLI